MSKNVSFFGLSQFPGSRCPAQIVGLHDYIQADITGTKIHVFACVDRINEN